MKKITKLVALLFVAGAMFMSCKQDADTRTTDFKLSNGKWELVADSKSSSEEIKGGVRIKDSIVYKETEMFKVSGDDITILSDTIKMETSVTLPEGTDQSVLDLFTALAEADKEEGDTLTVNGTTITLKSSHTATDEEIAEENADNPKVSDFVESFPAGVEIFTNKKKTIYKVYYPNHEESNSDYDPPLKSSSKTTLTFTKQK